MAVPMKLDWFFTTDRPAEEVIDRAAAAIVGCQRYKIATRSSSMVSGERIVRQWWWWALLFILFVPTLGIIWVVLALFVPRKSENVTVTAYPNEANGVIDVRVSGTGSIQVKGALEDFTQQIKVETQATSAPPPPPPDG